MTSRHRASTYSRPDPSYVVRPGLSSYSPQSYHRHSASAPAAVYTTHNTSSSRTTPRYHSDSYSYSRPSTSSSTPRTSQKGLSYTSTKDLGGWLGGAALTAGAAYLLRGGASRERESKDRGRDRDRERESRDRGRSSRRHHDDDYHYSSREKSRHRGKSEGRRRDEGRSERRSSHYYYR
jgi:hypothetical protein